MKKISIIVDSLTGRTKDQVEKMGFHFIPQITIIDGKEYRDGVDLVLERDIEMIDKAVNAKTSMPNVGELTNLYKDLSAQSDHVVYLPMSKSISGTYGAASAVAVSFPKVRVVDINLIGDAILYVAQLLKDTVEGGGNFEEAIKMVEKISKSNLTFLLPGRVEGMIRSGRLKGIKKIILEKSKLIPVLQMEATEVVVKGLKRTIEKSATAAVERIIELIGGADKIKNYLFEIAHTGGDVIKMGEKILHKFGITEFKVNWTATTPAAYLGKGSLAISAFLRKAR